MLLGLTACHVPPHAVERLDATAEAELVVENATPKLVCYVEARPYRDGEVNVGDAPYTHDRLAPGDAIAPGERRVFRLSRGTFDVLIWDCNRNALYERRRTELGTLSVTLSVP